MIKIKQGWFASAGLKFKWPYADPRGVGVPKSAFQGEGDIEIEVEGKLYKVPKPKALEEVRKYKSFFATRGLLLGIIPKQILEVVDNNPKLNL